MTTHSPSQDRPEHAAPGGDAPMRRHIVYLCEDFPASARTAGGVRVSVRQQAEQTAQHHRVTVAVMERRVPAIFTGKSTIHDARPEDARPADDELDVRVLRYRYWHVTALWPLLEPLQLTLLTLWVLARHARDAQIIHGHRVYPMGLPATIAGRLLGRRDVVTAYGSDIHMFAFDANRPRRALTRWVLRTARELIGVSASLLATLADLGVPASRRTFVPSGVDTERFTVPEAITPLRATLELPPDARVFLSINLFVPIKAHDVLIESFARVVAKEPLAFLVMTGDGPLRASIAERVRELGLDERVRFTGFVDYDAMPDWIGAADVLVLPSRNEGMPLSVLEGFACGKPLVGTRVGGIPELVDDPALGLLVEPDDVDALADAMLRALHTTWDAGQLRRRACEHGWTAVGERLRSVYEASGTSR